MVQNSKAIKVCGKMSPLTLPVFLNFPVPFPKVT